MLACGVEKAQHGQYPLNGSYRVVFGEVKVRMTRGVRTKCGDDWSPFSAMTLFTLRVLECPVDSNNCVHYYYVFFLNMAVSVVVRLSFLNLNFPLAGAAACVIRACLWLCAVRSQGGGGDRHAAPTGAAFISLVCLLSEWMSSSELEVTVLVCVCVCSRWRRACWTLGSLTAWWVWLRSSPSSRPRLPWTTWTLSPKASGIFFYYYYFFILVASLFCVCYVLSCNDVSICQSTECLCWQTHVNLNIWGSLFSLPAGFKVKLHVYT